MTSLTPFNKGGKLPSVFGSNYKSQLNIAGQTGVQVSFATITYKGRAWSVRYRGESNLITDERSAPVPHLDVVIVGVAPSDAKKYYAQRYQEGNSGPPDCWSVDGVAPDPTVKARQAPLCGPCQWNQFGSRITEAGKRAKACADSRRIAVVSLGDLDGEMYGGPALLALPAMSIRPFSAYCQKLDMLGFPLEGVATRIKFDYNVAYPKIEFEPLGLLGDEDAAHVVNEVMRNPIIDRMLLSPPLAEDGGGGGEPGSASVPLASSEPVVKQSTVIEQPAPAPAPEPPKVVDIPKRKASPFGGSTAPAPAAPKPAAKPEEPPPAAASAPAPAPNKPLPPVPGDLAEMIDEMIAS